MASEPMLSPPLVPLEMPPPPNEGLARDLAGIVGEANVSIDPADRMRAARDMWPKSFLWERQGLAPSPPDVVVRPGTVDEIAAVVRLAGERSIPLMPYGAGSGVCGGAIPVRGGITVRLDRLDRILQIDREALTVDVEAGVLGIRLEEALREQGLTLGHFPSSIACSSVGGWLATRSGGQSSSRYGKIEDMVRSMRCVLGTGEVVELERPASGIDWTELMMGSEGALGIIASARFRLWPAPEIALPRGFRFPSQRAGLAAVEAIFRAGLRPSVVRLYDPLSTEVALGPLASKEKCHGAVPPSPKAGTHPRGPPALEDLRPVFHEEAPARRAVHLLSAIARGGLRDAPAPLRALAWAAAPSLRDDKEDASVAGALREAARDLAGAGRNLALSRAEAINRAMSLARRSLLVLVHEGRRGEAEPEAAEARAICEAHGGRDLGEEPGAKWLRDRWAVSYGLPRIFESNGWVDTFEVAAPWGKVASVYDSVRAAVSPHALVMAHFSHAYPDGCSIYFTFTGAARSPEEGLAGYDAAWAAALDAALAEGATLTHHHGVGLLKAPWLREELGEGGLELLRQVRRAWDPREILNPGKLGLDRIPTVSSIETARERRAFQVDRSRLTSIDPIDERAMWIRAYAGAPIAHVEARLRARGLTLGSQPPSILLGTVADWLEGPFAGRRIEGDRLASGVASVEAVLPDGLLFVSHAAPRSAAGPDVAQLLLGGGGRHGQLVAATLKAEPLPRTLEIAVTGSAALLRRWIRTCVRDPIPPREVEVTGGERPVATLTFATGTDRLEARSGRALAAARSLGLLEVTPPGVRDVRPLGSEERSRTTEEWLDLLSALPSGQRLRLVRIGRESAVVA